MFKDTELTGVGCGGNYRSKCDLRSEEPTELGNAAGQQELSELNKWCGEYPQHKGYAKPTKPAVRG